ncbi:hypothetical protein [Azospirillum sp. TSO5]|uniref:hypothetical protein n=1 Tax=Azospirillum sp. TSO5 TaxID=716760 RepID=UPI000D6093AF|nr:hypothetical protein [Azospirillum sp. TSO5]PWC93291.1 hypothetical protein TSO5_15170 [Azospirillum sp. TSO5]
MFEDPFASLSFIAGPAILTNACAILQNGATTRFNLAIAQWRDFRASVGAGDDRIALQYADPEAAVVLAGRQVRLQLRGMALLNSAVALLSATATFLLESACGWALIRLHRGGDGSAAALPLPTHTHPATGDVQCPPFQS